ncbi:uncharacterized protein LOC109823840 [Asparagus officinalis]|uniref:uncharacterized protein LOC109823840 n=1 Tax=Asparagus officinalis TaxID=4686 RepID=UPI00098DF594|nr:uncharacterized protein LOC109823840 [Asparagus officinalis]
MTDDEVALLGKLNKEILDPTSFNIRIIDSTCVFVHNLKIPSVLAARLDKAQINRLTKFCSQKIHRRYNIIVTSNSSINREELYICFVVAGLTTRWKKQYWTRLTKRHMTKGMESYQCSFFTHSMTSSRAITSYI